MIMSFLLSRADVDSDSLLLDTASVYRNESDIGTVLPQLLEKHSLQRSDLFITSKLGKGLIKALHLYH